MVSLHYDALFQEWIRQSVCVFPSFPVVCIVLLNPVFLLYIGAIPHSMQRNEECQNHMDGKHSNDGGVEVAVIAGVSQRGCEELSRSHELPKQIST